MAPVRLAPGIVAWAVLAWVLASLAGLLFGPIGLPIGDSLAALASALPGVDLHHDLTSTELKVLYEIRAPRVAMGSLVGAVLATGGAAYQGVFRNPLADPYLLGVAAGAGLGATIAFGLGMESELVTVLAFAGAIGAVATTYVLGRSMGNRTATALILAGVAVSAFATAFQTYLLQRNVETLRSVYTWVFGRLTTVGWGEVVGLLPYAVGASALIVFYRRSLDVLGVGDDEAAALGLDVDRVRWIVVLAATLATAAAVSVSGLIGFVGIIVPHTVRLMTSWSYRVIVPVSLVLGAAFLVGADIVARTVAAPAELPIGIVTAFVGAPFFLVVLRSVARPR
jgi:iron complex transport system permease protein